MALCVLGIGTVCALGSGIDNFKLGLKAERQPNIVQMPVKHAHGAFNLPVYQALVEGLDRFIPRRALRRIDGFAKMALLSTHLAIEDAGIEFEDKSRVGIIVGSGNGPIRTTFSLLDGIIDYGDHCASPIHFANSLHNALASQISIFLNINGPCTTITCFNHTVANVLLTAQNWLNVGMVDYIIAGLGDEYCDVLGYSAVAYGAGNSDSIQPFNFKTCTFLPGEGYVTYLLTRDSEKSMYGNIEKININKPVSEIEEEILSDSKAVLLSAKGIISENESFEKIDLTNKKVAAYSPLYGSMPVTAAFDISTALVSLKDKVIYPSPQNEANSDEGMNIINQKIKLDKNSSITCIELAEKDSFNIYVLKGV